MTAFTVLATITIRTVFLEVGGKDLEMGRIFLTCGILVLRTQPLRRMVARISLVSKGIMMYFIIFVHILALTLYNKLWLCRQIVY